MQTLNIIKPLHIKMTEHNTLPLTGTCPEQKRNDILKAFDTSFELYELVFKQLKTEESWTVKPITLRHPLMFYYGHTAAFYINKLNIGGFINERINPKLEKMVAIGVDEMSWDDLNESHYDWPSHEVMHEFRQQCRALVTKFIKTMPITLPIKQSDPAWIILMGIEHEHIHLETTSVLMRQQRLHLICPVQELEQKRYQLSSIVPGQAPKNSLVLVPQQSITLGKRDETYGWDNEYGSEFHELRAFQASKFLVSNAEYLEFVADGGYSTPKYWTEEGLGWVTYTKATCPTFWVDYQNPNDVTGVKLRLAAEIVQMQWSWPVEVNHLEATAFCAWKSLKTASKTRLIREAEWHVLYQQAQGGQWNCGLRYTSEGPVDAFQANNSEFCDVQGNAWAWTETEFHPFEGFQTHSCYKDFSSPCFDTKHNIMVGGSWVSCGNEILESARYAFRRHFFQFCGIRYVQEQ